MSIKSPELAIRSGRDEAPDRFSSGSVPMLPSRWRGGGTPLPPDEFEHKQDIPKEAEALRGPRDRTGPRAGGDDEDD